MKFWLFVVWREHGNERKILIKANTEIEAEIKLNNSNVECDDYYCSTFEDIELVIE